MKAALLSAFFAATLATPMLAQDSSEEIFAQWDLNSNGQISVLEARSILTTMFSQFDTNLDGYLDDDDTAGDEAAEAPDSEEGAVALAFADTDGDARVSLLEFIEQDDNWINLMDRDGNGVVTIEDFNTL